MKTKFLLLVSLAILIALPAFAASLGGTPCPPSSPWPPTAGPVVKTVPWVPPTAPFCLITPHDAISGNPAPSPTNYLKATTDSTAVAYYWDYGDGSPAMSWTPVSNPYDIGAPHTYTGTTGTSFTATVYVKDNATPPNVNSAKYYLTIRDSSLQVKSNLAIDEALWRMHREMNRYGSGSTMYGYWNSGNYTSSGYIGNYAVNTTAFLANGHAMDSDPANPDPYAETAMRGVNGVLENLSATAIPNVVTNARGTFNPDGNNNGLAVYVSTNGEAMYQGGMVMDMIAATGQPTFVAQVGASGIVSQPLQTILQDMVDYYTYCQNINSGGYNGGWRYSCRSGDSDNSVCQWAAIGMIAAHDQFGINYPPPLDPILLTPVAGTSPVLLANQDWLNYDFDGYGYGYTQPGYYPWGPWALTPSGMVQSVMSGLGRGTPGSPTQWDHVEDWVRANFSGPLGYYYGLFSFTKSMLLYPGGSQAQLCNRDGFPSNNLTNCIDWLNADTANGDVIDGVAKTLTNNQQGDGYWWCHEQSGTQCYFETAWATIMLNKTVFKSGLPVAVIDASPSTVINGGTVNFTGKNSFQQDSTKKIVLWEWDFSGTGSGAFSASGVSQNGVVISTTSTTFPVSFPVRLRVTDNTTPTPLTAIATMTITITNPPFPPTANAGGPYNICPQAAYLPFYLNGTGSTAAPGHLTGSNDPNNYITNYEWDLLGSGTYVLSGATLSQPRVDDYYAAQGLLGSGSSVLVSLRVTDNSVASFGAPANLQGVATANLRLLTASDELCTHCVLSAQAVAHGAVPGKAGYIQLVWLETGQDHYNIYRGTVNGGPYTLIGSVKNTLMGTGKSLGYTDSSNLTPGVIYYYRIAPATLADVETCQSNQANVSGTLPKGR